MCRASGSALKGTGPRCRSDPRRDGKMRDNSQLPHPGCLYAGSDGRDAGKPRAGSNPCIWARFVFTAPRPRPYVPRLTATTGGCQPWPPLLRLAVP